MGAKSRRVRKVRDAAEFSVPRLSSVLIPPATGGRVYSWSLEDIMSARDDQMRGRFQRAAALAAAMRTDDAIAVARANRLAPQRCIKVEIVAAPGSRGKMPANEAEPLFGQDGVAIAPGTRGDIIGCLVDHGVAFAYNVWTPRDDGTRTDVEVRYWPIEHVRWDDIKRCYVTRVARSDDERASYSIDEEPIVHADGQWVVFAAFDHSPHSQDAAILPGSLVWARHGFAVRDWAKSSVAHGSAKVIGEMPEGVALQDAQGVTPEGASMMQLLQAIASSDAPVGIRPAGSKTDFLTNTSTAWQIFSELVHNAEKAAARIYLGTDGTLGSQGGAPGVDVQALFGVAATKVQGDLDTITRALQTGVIEPWCAINFGDSSVAPTRHYMLPDSDADAARASLKERTASFFAHLESAKENGFVIDQKYVDAVAEEYDVMPPSLPAATEAKAPTIALAPTDIARVISVNEARASAGLPVLTGIDGSEDPDGNLTVEQFGVKKAAQFATPPAAPHVAPALRSVP